MIFSDKDKNLYDKYMAFHHLMLEDHTAIEIASTLAVQALSFYRTMLTEEDYDVMIKTIYDSRHQPPKFDIEG